MASLDDAVWNMLQNTFNNLKPARKHNETKILMTVFWHIYFYFDVDNLNLLLWL